MIVQSPDITLQAIFDVSLDAIVSVDSAGVIVEWNLRAAELFGWSKSEVVGRRVSELMLPADSCEQFFRTIVSVGQIQVEESGERPTRDRLFVQNRAGVLFPVDLAVQVVRLATQRLYLLFFSVNSSSIGESVESSLGLSHPTSTVTADVSQDAIVGKSLEGQITSWNKGAQQVFGYTTAEAIGQPYSMLSAGENDHEEQELTLVVQHGIRLNEFETVRRHKDGRVFSVSMTVSPLHDASGKVIGTFSIERDVTCSKSREDHLIQATRIAEAASRTKNEFLANVSHELRTPMNAIIGMIDLSLTTGDLSPVVQGYLQTASESAHILLSLLNDLLDFSRMDAGHFELDPQPFSLRQMLEETMRILALRAHERGIELSCDVQHDVPDRLEGDVGRLRQIVMNLAGNAIKFTEQGEVIVRVGVESQNDTTIQLLISVQDTGIGIAKEDWEKIFAPFTQADASSTRRFAGTGLGLSICRELIERMQGRIWLQSKLGRGTTFFCNPRFQCAVDVLSDEPPMVRELRDLRVLIVDDNETTRRILETVTSHLGMRPDVVPNAASALDRLRSASRDAQPYSMLMIDGLMPEMDGFTLIEEIHGHHLSNAPVILMLSSTDRSTFEERCRNLPVNVFLEKPVSQFLIMDALLTAMGASPSRRGISSKTTLSGQSLKILVAEDAPANQKVVRAVLERRGHQVEIAYNGRQAVDSLERSDYDVILMDVQMPTMDGIQATSAIRSLRKEKSSAHVPIIAMTAHAMRGDRERCIAAGMDGYISKPIDAKELVSLVEKMARESQKRKGQAVRYDPAAIQKQMQQGNVEPTNDKSGRSGQLETAGRTYMATPETRANLLQTGSHKVDPATDTQRDEPRAVVASAEEKPVMLWRAALARLGGNESLLRDLATFFLDDSEQLIEELKAALKSEDGERVHRTVHSLKGLAANFSADPCTAMAQTVEDAAKLRNLKLVSQLLPRLRAEVDRLNEALRRDILHVGSIVDGEKSGTNPPNA